jgi:hypothetical protein
MSNRSLSREIVRQRNRTGLEIAPWNIVIFNSENYHKGVVEKVRSGKATIKVPKDPNKLNQASGTEIDGMRFTEDVSKIIRKDFQPQDFNDGARYLICNKFRSEDVGGHRIKWSTRLKDDLFTLIDGNLKMVVTKDEDRFVCWKFLEYIKDGEPFWIPATSLIPIPISQLMHADIGLDKNFQLTEKGEEIVFPLGQKAIINENDIKQALNITVERRKKTKLAELENTRRQVIQLTEQLAGAQCRNEELVTDLDLLSENKVDDSKIERTKRVLNNLWDEFRVEYAAGVTKMNFGGHIVLERDGKRYDIGYCNALIEYPDNLRAGNNPKIHIRNSNSRGGHPHPYVDSSGVPCFGGHSGEYAKYLAAGDVERLGIFLHSFLTQPIGGGYGKPEQWDEIR